MHIAIFDDCNRIPAFWDEWEYTGLVYPFQTRLFVSTWLDTVGRALQRQPRLVIVEDKEGQPLLLFPLVLRQRYGAKVLEFCGGLLCDYEAPAMSSQCPPLDATSMRTLWRDIIRECGADVAHLRQIPPYMPSCTTISPRSNPLALLAVTEAGSSAAAFIGNLGAEAYMHGQLKKRIQQDSRRQRKRLGELGEVHWGVAQSASEAVYLTRKMVEQKRVRYAETHVFDIFSDAGTEAFYEAMAQHAWQKRGDMQVHVSALWVGNECVSVHWGILFNKIFYYLMPAYAGGGWRRFSCGRLHLEDLLRTVVNAGCVIFDFTVGAESYKKDWCNREFPLYVSCTSLTCKGYVYSALRSVKQFLQRRHAI